MIDKKRIPQARHELLECATHYFSDQSDVVGIILAGSIPSGTSDLYSDIDLRIIASPKHHAYLVENRLSIPMQWEGWLFNEWLEATEHCVSHFKPFFKIDIFYWRDDRLVPSPWYSLPVEILLDRDGTVKNFINESLALDFLPADNREVSRILSKAIACTHEVVRRARRGELFYAHTLLEESRQHIVQIEDWLCGFYPTCAADLKLGNRISNRLETALSESYVALDAEALESAAEQLCHLLLAQIPQMHEVFDLSRPMNKDLEAVRIITDRQPL